MPLPTRAAAALWTLMIGLLAGCGISDLTAPECDAIAAVLVSRVEVRPATVTVNLGQSVQMKATALSCAGLLADVGAFHWRSGNAAVATVSPSGLVEAVSTGQVQIFAAAQGKEESALITTQPVQVARVKVEPASATVGVGRTSRLTARALDAQGRDIAGRPVSWTSASSGIVSVGPLGDVTGVTAGGPVAVTATIEGKSASAQITVALVPVNSVVVTPAAPTIQAATTVQLTATLRDELANVLTGRAVNWTSSDPAIASVTGAGGLVTGDQPGTVTITAASEGKTGTARVTVTLGAPALLEFIQQPGTGEAGSAIAPPITVAIEDAAGNRIVSATAAITLALTLSADATLGGTVTVNAVNGLATFGDVSVSTSGDYSLTAASAGLTSVTSTSFVIRPRPATRLAFVAQPVKTEVGSSLGTVTVELQDATGARVTGQTAAISLAIGTNPGQGSLTGSTTETTAGGLATFTGLRIDRIGNGYTLIATANGLTTAISDPFGITAGAASQLTFSQEPPGTVTVGETVSPELSVQLRDAGANAVSQAGWEIVLTMSGGGVLTSASATTDASGLATFTGLVATAKTQTGYRFTANSPGLGPATSQTFEVIAGAATQLAFLTQPGNNSRAGLPIMPPVLVELRDAAGNRAVASTITVTMALGANAGEATLAGNVVLAENGVATFPDLRVNRPGKDYTLVAAAPGLTGATSMKFRVR